MDKLIMDVSHIKSTIGGNPSLGSKGMMSMLEDHGKKISQYESDRAKVIGISAAASIFFTAIGTFLMNLFFKH